MATENLKSTPVTSLDANPVTNNQVEAGSGAGSLVRSAMASITATTGKTTGGTYQMLRLPSNAILQSVRWWIDTTVTTFDGDVGFYYSTSHIDGTKQSNVADVVSGTTAPNKVNSTTGAQILGAGIDLHTAAAPAELIHKVTGAKLYNPLWQLCGVSADPGGFFDLTLTNTSTTSGAPVFNVHVLYVQ